MLHPSLTTVAVRLKGAGSDSKEELHWQGIKIQYAVSVAGKELSSFSRETVVTRISALLIGVVILQDNTVNIVEEKHRTTAFSFEKSRKSNECTAFQKSNSACFL